MMLQQSDPLYNVKSFFPIENQLIQMGENNLKEMIQRNIESLGIYQPQSKQYQIQDDEILCSICGNPDYEERNNQMVICSGCNLAVH